MKTYYNLFLVAVLAWCLPTIASAQDSLRERLEERARSVEVDGHAFYRLRAETNEPYNDLLVLAAPGTTPEQIDALNIGYVNYACRSDGRRRVPPTRNGRFVDGGVEPTIDFATFASSECADGTASRELVVGAPYNIPREIIRSPSELLNEITSQIVAATPTEVRALVNETRDQAQALIIQGVPPSVSVAYADAVSEALNRLPSTTVGAPPGHTVDPYAADGSDVSAALAVAQAHATELELDLVAARLDTVGYRLATRLVIPLIILLIVVLAWALMTRKKGIINLSESQANLLRKQLNEEWQLKLDDMKRNLDTANAKVKALHAIYEDATQKKVALEDFPGALKAYLKDAFGVAKTALPIAPQALQVPPAKSMFEATEKNYTEIFRDVLDGALKTEEGLAQLKVKLGRMLDSTAKEALGFLLGSTHDHLQLQVAWAGAVGDNLALNTGNIKQLASGVHPGLELAVTLARRDRDQIHRAELSIARGGFEEERQRLTDRIGELLVTESEVVRLQQDLAESQAKPSSDHVLERVGTIRDMIDTLWRGEFGDILDHVGRKRDVNAEKVRVKFSKERTFEHKRRGQPVDIVKIHELLGPTLTTFLRSIHEDGFTKVVDELDELLGRKRSEHTPAPGAHQVPAAGEPSAESLMSGNAPPPAAVPSIVAPSGLGTEDLEHQEEGETTERPADLEAAITRAAEEASDDDALAGDLTRMHTNPYGAAPSGSNGANGSRPGEETTKVVHLDGEGRPRRDTVRGIAAAPRSEPPPEPEPVAE